MPLKIGCFGSILTFAPQRDVCKACELRDACAKKVFEREPEVLNLLRLRETERGTKKEDEIEGKALSDARRYFTTRRKRYLSPARTTASRADQDYESMIERGVDFSAISKGENPISTTFYPQMREAVDFIIKERLFTPRDLVEHLCSTGVCKTSATARVYANRIVSILIKSGQITKEGKVYCLPA